MDLWNDFTKDVPIIPPQTLKPYCIYNDGNSLRTDKDYLFINLLGID